jgi:hypothetical protein
VESSPAELVGNIPERGVVGVFLDGAIQIMALPAG